MYWGLRSRFIRIFHFHRNLVFSYEMQRPVSSSFIGDRLKFVNFLGGPLTCNAAQGRKVRGIAARGRNSRTGSPKLSCHRVHPEPEENDRD